MNIKKSIKTILKRILPLQIRNKINDVRGTITLYSDSLSQTRRFNKSYSRPSSRELSRIEPRLEFLTHQLEKGLSHKNFRYNFGKKIFDEMPLYLSLLENKDPDYINNPFHHQAIIALHDYFVKHKKANKDISWQESLFTPTQLSLILDNYQQDSSTLTIRKQDKENNSKLSFIDLTEARHSLRDFSDEPITAEEIEQAIAIAMRTPSVCNRQPSRVYILLNPDLIKKALQIQGGVTGFATPPSLILITSDLQAFMNGNERNEGYTDGGLFGMSLLYALEALGIAACPLNTMFSRNAEKKTRELLHLKSSEIPVMYIQAGHFPEEAKTCASKRLPAEAITTIIK